MTTPTARLSMTHRTRTYITVTGADSAVHAATAADELATNLGLDTTREPATVRGNSKHGIYYTLAYKGSV